jgi:CTP synthase (UTP-ammonia lyase)
MSDRVVVGIAGEFDKTFAPHLATNDALQHAAAVLAVEVEARWLRTDDLAADLRPLHGVDAIWCAPGAPYSSMTGALDALRFGRENLVPTIGTCGGCQHMIIEYARNVLGIEDADHAEYDPYASRLIISKLTCSLVGRVMAVRLTPGSRVAEHYGELDVTEHYYCNFGLNPEYQDVIHEGGFLITGTDVDGEPRVFELPDHPFYIATLFVPQNRSTREDPHPLIMAVLRAALERKEALAAASV